MPDELMLCIICTEMKPIRPPGRGEHVIPYALGGSFKINRVCLDCDNDLGNRADAGLINLTMMEERRAELGLAGHNGVVPDPSAKQLRTPLVSVDDPNHKIIREVGDSGEVVAKTKTVVEFRVEQFPEGMLIEPARVYIDPADADKAGMYARSALKKAGIKDEAVLERIIREFVEGLETVEKAGEFLQKVTTVEGGHQVGLLKIAYELSWYWLGDEWLNDPVAMEMREMLTGRKNTIRLRAKILDDPNEGIIAVDGDQRVLHVAYAYPFNGQVVLFIRLFDLMAVGFSVTESVGKYTVPELNAVVMQNVQRQYEEVHFGELGPGQVAWTHDPQNSRIK